MALALRQRWDLQSMLLQLHQSMASSRALFLNVERVRGPLLSLETLRHRGLVGRSIRDFPLVERKGRPKPSQN